MLEIARLTKEIQNEKTLVFAAFVNEESPCCGTQNMGSMVYAKNLKKLKVPVEVMICLESIGYFSKDESQQYPFPGMRLFYPRAADFLGVVGNLRSIRNVAKALSLDHDRKLAHIRKSVPRLMINPVKEYAGLKGSVVYERFQTHEVKYFCFMLRKT